MTAGQAATMSRCVPYWNRLSTFRLFSSTPIVSGVRSQTPYRYPSGKSDTSDRSTRLTHPNASPENRWRNQRSRASKTAKTESDKGRHGPRSTGRNLPEAVGSSSRHGQQQQRSPNRSQIEQRQTGGDGNPRAHGPRTHLGTTPHGGSSSPLVTPQLPWRPAKKLTYQAMAGLKALHANDPVTFDKNALSERFGISYEAVGRILRSKYQDRKAGDGAENLRGTKWDTSPSSSKTSPVPAVQRAFAMRGATRQARPPKSDE